MVKIVLERDTCIGCGSCEAVCPKYWKMADDSKVNYLGKEEVSEVECNQEAADICPVQCIHITK